MSAPHRKKLKSLMAMMLRWAERDKTITHALRKHELPKHAYEVPEDWKKAFKYITGLDMKLDMKYATALTKEEMYKCNKYYKEYRC
jgi:phosphoribosyl 1,2-cyclic phosphodiesterase